MGLALQAAERAAQCGEVPVGAVLLDATGHVVCTTHNLREGTHDPSAHAEVLALREAGQLLADSHLEGCTLVVTVEPCTMCAGAIQLARLERVVFGAWEPKTGACGSLRDVLRDTRATHQVQVVGGVREAECAALMRDFFARRRDTSSCATDHGNEHPWQ